MREPEIAVTFEPQGKKVFVLSGTKIIEAAALAGAALNLPCGGQGTCGKCKVRVVDNPCDPTDTERKTLDREELDSGVRLACQSCICASTTIDIPETSLLASSYQVLSAVDGGIVGDVNPAVRKQYVELPKPSRDDPAADLERLYGALGVFTADLALARALPARLRTWDFRGTAVRADHQLIDFEQGNTERQRYCVAFDIGTTSVVGSLLDLESGRECANTSRMNPQTRFGDDVLSRILRAREQDDGAADLREVIVAEVNEMILELLDQAGVPKERVYEAVFAGNTTMQQLLLGLDTAALGEVPFVPVTARGQLLAAAAVGVAIHPRGRVYVFPVIGGFLGGDTVAGILATDLENCPTPTVFVDIGTNGEIVLSYDGQMLAASTAAGPAFEGARITHGMRAVEGAIEKVIFDGDARVNIIGNVSPIGLCGSALIDVAAELRRHGMLMREGLLLAPEHLPADLPEAIRKRVTKTDNGVAFLLASANESGTQAPIVLTQGDVRELQLATGAVRAGMSILLRRAGLKVEQLGRVLIAGGFGNFIRRSNAQCIGLLPSGLDHHRLAFVGNTSLAGARMAAISQTARACAEQLARRIKRIDLSLDPAFQAEFVNAMTFPSIRPEE